MLNSWILLLQENLFQPWTGILVLSPTSGLCKELLNNICCVLDLLALVPPMVTLHCHM